MCLVTTGEKLGPRVGSYTGPTADRVRRPRDLPPAQGCAHPDANRIWAPPPTPPLRPDAPPQSAAPGRPPALHSTDPLPCTHDTPDLGSPSVPAPSKSPATRVKFGAGPAAGVRPRARRASSRISHRPPPFLLLPRRAAVCRRRIPPQR